jgi:hypothetical protein
MTICTPDGCQEPYRLNFGGSRLGAMVSRNLTIRSTGDVPLELRAIELATGTSSEFASDPSGNVSLTLQPGEETVVRVTHAARDGQADTGNLEIISNAERARVLVALSTEYKGTPTLAVVTDPTQSRDVTTVDFGTVTAGRRESRVVYIKNRDPVLDGSILGLTELRVDPASSSDFTVAADAPLPAFVNQFNALCATNGNCAGNAGDTCDTTLGVCARAGGGLRDVITATITFVGSTPGPIAESIVLLTNDGGSPGTRRTIAVRANVTFAELDVTPDPIVIDDAFVGYTARRTVTLRNGGTAPLEVRAVSVAGHPAFAAELSALPLPLTLGAMETRTFPIAFAPTQVGTATAALTVTSGDAAMPTQTIPIQGVARIAPELALEPAALDFGDVHQGVSVPATVTVRNRGGTDLLVSSIAVTGPSSALYTSDAQNLPPIAPGGSATFVVRRSTSPRTTRARAGPRASRSPGAVSTRPRACSRRRRSTSTRGPRT